VRTVAQATVASVGCCVEDTLGAGFAYGGRILNSAVALQRGTDSLHLFLITRLGRAAKDPKIHASLRDAQSSDEVPGWREIYLGFLATVWLRFSIFGGILAVGAAYLLDKFDGRPGKRLGLELLTFVLAFCVAGAVDAGWRIQLGSRSSPLPASGGRGRRWDASPHQALPIERRNPPAPVRGSTALRLANPLNRAKLRRHIRTLAQPSGRLFFGMAVGDERAVTIWDR
jgi:hypothetical protein